MDPVPTTQAGGAKALSCLRSRGRVTSVTLRRSGPIAVERHPLDPVRKGSSPISPTASSGTFNEILCTATGCTSSELNAIFLLVSMARSSDRSFWP